jgi:hypothetical protein
MPTALFSLGQIVATPGAIKTLSESNEGSISFLRRHQCGDWGELSPEDKALNSGSVSTGGRILSAYRTKKGVKFWVITEADRSSTCILLPSEY